MTASTRVRSAWNSWRSARLEIGAVRPATLARPSTVLTMFSGDERPAQRCSREVKRRRELVGRQRARRGKQPAQRHRRLVAGGRHGSWPGSMSFTSWKYNSSPGSWRPRSGSSRKPSWSPRSWRERISPANQLGQPVEDREVVRAREPRAARELVDLVAGLAAEQLDEVAALARDGVHGERGRVAREAIRAVAARQAREEAVRVDARLRPESDDAAVALAGGRRRDDEHRVVQAAHEAGEVA